MRVSSVDHVRKDFEGVFGVLAQSLHIDLQKSSRDGPFKDLCVDGGLGAHVRFEVLNAASDEANGRGLQKRMTVSRDGDA